MSKSLAIFDFDGTLYSKDSLLEFCLFIYKKLPIRGLFIFAQLFWWTLYIIKFITKQQFKSKFFIFLYGIKPATLQLLLNDFWAQENHLFNKDVVSEKNRLQNQDVEIVCVSASPELFIQPALVKLNIQHVIATNLCFNNSSYYIDGENCRGLEKINRLIQHPVAKSASIDYVYSDNADDICLQILAKKKSYIVKNNKLYNMKDALSPKVLVEYLKTQNSGFGFLDTLKITYRPYICPFHELIPLVSSDDFVFDIGCGSGQFMLLLSAFCKPKRIEGVEISQSLVDNANSLFSKSEIESKFAVYNGIDFPDTLSDATVVFMIDVIHHIPKALRRQVFDNIYSKLKPGAKLIIKDINAGSPFVVFNKLHDLVISREISREVSLQNLKHMLTEVGFEVTSTSTKQMLVYPHMTITVTKNI